MYNVTAAEGSQDYKYNPRRNAVRCAIVSLILMGCVVVSNCVCKLAPCYPSSTTIVMRVLPVDAQIKSTIIDVKGYGEEHLFC